MPRSEPGRLVGRDLVCFANDWTGDPLSKRHIMTRLVPQNRVLWIDSLGNRPPRATPRDLGRIAARLRRAAAGVVEVRRNLWVLSPLALPLYGAGWARSLNSWLVGVQVRHALRQLGFGPPIVYSFVPSSAPVVDRLGASLVVYHCVDEYSAFRGAGPAIATLEEELIDKSDLVVTCSTALEEAKGRLHPRTALVRHGVEHAHFARALDPATEEPDWLAALPRPRIGFYGLIADWVDLGLVAEVARALPNATVVLVGEVHDDARSQLPLIEGLGNVVRVGRRPYAELPQLCRGLDVALLPFAPSSLTRASNPLKLREYLAAGLPVVSTPIPEAERLSGRGVRIARSASEFVAEVAAALTDLPGARAARSNGVAHESWDHVVQELERLLLALDEEIRRGATPTRGRPAQELRR